VCSVDFAGAEHVLKAGDLLGVAVGDGVGDELIGLVYSLGWRPSGGVLVAAVAESAGDLVFGGMDTNKKLGYWTLRL